MTSLDKSSKINKNTKKEMNKRITKKRNEDSGSSEDDDYSIHSSDDDEELDIYEPGSS